MLIQISGRDGSIPIVAMPPVGGANFIVDAPGADHGPLVLLRLGYLPVFAPLAATRRRERFLQWKSKRFVPAPGVAYGQGFAIMNASVLAKVMFADNLHIGENLGIRPLVYPVLFKSAVYRSASI